MQKLKMHSTNFTEQNIASLRELFPGCVTEAKDENGNLKLAVDFDQLKQELSGSLVDGPQERYHLNWPGKREALLTANAPIAKTLRPCFDESVDFDTTKNLFIEGDNLDALKLLQETYLGKVKMIYIDPPYNTGKDFIYEDDFAQNTDEFLRRSNQKDDQGNKLVTNTESNGRFHSDWLSMMYSRLKLARNLLRDDGLIFVSISDHENSALRYILNEIFGESNFIGCVVWNSTKSVTNTALISVGHTYNLIYAKNKEYFVENRTHFRLSEDGSGFSNSDNDPRGPWKADPFQVGGWRPNQQYVIVNPITGDEYNPNPGSSWKNDFDTFQKLMADNRIVFGVSGEAGPQRKRFLSEALDRGKVAKTWWDQVATTTNGTSELKKLFDGYSVFSNPKPVDLIKNFIELGDHTGQGIIMDFFAGSSTTAHGVMELNAEKGTKRTFIMIQLPQSIDEYDKDNNSVVEYLGKNNLRLNIAEISKQRIKLSSETICNKSVYPFDKGFRVLKVDSSNMQDVFYTPDEIGRDLLDGLSENIKPERSSEDLLFQVLLDWGVDLSLPISKKNIGAKEVFFVDENALIACFDDNLDEQLVKELAGFEPLRVVFKDSGFVSDAVKINVGQIFKQLSPTSELKVI